MTVAVRLPHVAGLQATWDGEVARFFVPGRPELLSNDRHTWQVSFRLRALVKEQGGWAAKALRQRHPGLVLDRCFVVTTPYQGNRGRGCDAGALAPWTKCFLDGLVSVGLLEDDDGSHIAGETFLPPVRSGPRWRGVEVRLHLVKGSHVN